MVGENRGFELTEKYKDASTGELMPSWRGSYAAWGGGATIPAAGGKGAGGGHICTPPHTIRSLQRRSCVGSQHTPSVPSDAMAENSGKFLRRFERRVSLPGPTVGWGPLMGGGEVWGGGFPEIEFRDFKQDSDGLYLQVHMFPISYNEASREVSTGYAPICDFCICALVTL